jgi:hypothetical protein
MGAPHSHIPHITQCYGCDSSPRAGRPAGIDPHTGDGVAQRSWWPQPRPRPPYPGGGGNGCPCRGRYFCSGRSSLSRSTRIIRCLTDSRTTRGNAAISGITRCCMMPPIAISSDYPGGRHGTMPIPAQTISRGASLGDRDALERARCRKPSDRGGIDRIGPSNVSHRLARSEAL